jgi:hypothetical protein
MATSESRIAVYVAVVVPGDLVVAAAEDVSGSERELRLKSGLEP